MNENRFRLLGVQDRFITTPNIKQFQQDIIAVFSQKDVQVISANVNGKENKSHNDLEYISYVNNLYSKFKLKIQISPQIDAWTIINKSFLTISYPPPLQQIFPHFVE